MLLSSQNLYISGSKENLEKSDDKSDNLVESAIQEVNGFGLYQVRSLILLGLPPLSIFQLWVMQVFWGQVPKHDCVNGTSVLIPCQNSTECDIVMNSTYTADFDLLCDRKDLYPQVQSTDRHRNHGFYKRLETIFRFHARTNRNLTIFNSALDKKSIKIVKIVSLPTPDTVSFAYWICHW